MKQISLLRSIKTSFKIIFSKVVHTPEDVIFQVQGNCDIKLEDFYNSLIQKYGKLPNISPIKVDRFVHIFAKWLARGEKVIELGCGDGMMATHVLKIKNSNIQEFYLVDFADKVLKETKKRIKNLPNKKRVTVCNPINIHNLADELQKENYFDRVIAINVLGDTNINTVLQQIFKIMHPGGLLLATFYDKDIADKFWKNYDGSYYFSSNKLKESVWLTPHRWYKGTEKIEPMKIYPKNRKPIKFLRAQMALNIKEAKKKIKKVGFEILSDKEIFDDLSLPHNTKTPSSVISNLLNQWPLLSYPEKMVLENWGTKLNQDQKLLIKKWGGYPEVFAIVVRKPPFVRR